MTNQEWQEVTRDLYLIYGKILKQTSAELANPLYTDCLINASTSIGKAVIEVEAITQSQIIDNPDEFLTFQEEIFKIKKQVYLK